MTHEWTFRGGETWRNPWDDYRSLRAAGPVQSMDTPDGQFWVVPRFAELFDAVRDTETFSSASGLAPVGDSINMFEDTAAPIVMMDPPVHTAMRRLVSRPMTPRRVAPIEPAITAFVDERLDHISGGSADIVEVLFKPLPSFVVAHYLGVPPEDRQLFDRWTTAIVSANASGEIAGASATVDLFTYAMELIERRKLEPADDLVSDLVGLGEDEASAMWILGFIFTMVTGGNDTVTGLLGGAAELLTAHRDQRQILLDNPTLIRPAVDEFLRLTSPVQNLARTATRDIDFHGARIAEGDKVHLLYGSANRDEREFGPTAADLDVTRTIDRSVALGYGAHHCLGASAARLQGGIAVERLLDRFPNFTVDAVAGVFAPGPFVRRYESLPFTP